MSLYKNVYLIGSGRTAGDCLKVLHQYRKDVEYICVEEEKFGFLTKLCQRLSIPCIHTGKEGIREFLLSMQEPSLIISAHNGYVFPKEVVEKENLKIINMHIALLPKYRGMNAPTWEIFHQEEYAGTTWHEVSPKIDNGGIIVQGRFPIGPHDTAMTVLRKSFELGVELLKEHAEAFLSNEYHVTIPTEKTKLYLGKDKPNNGYMDEGWDIEKKYAFLRSMDYKGTNLMPYPKVHINGKIYEIQSYKLSKETEEKVIHMPEHNYSKKYSGGGYCLICELQEAVEPAGWSPKSTP